MNAVSASSRKGQRTATNILEAAEHLFAQRGYAGTSLRAIARGAGLQEPGIYNHFESKEAVYAAVIQRALGPIAEALAARITTAETLPDFIELPSLLMDHLAARPHVAALLQRALQEDASRPGNEILHRSMTELFNRGVEGIAALTGELSLNRDTLSINLIAIFNLTTGYFVSQPAFDTLAGDDLLSEANLNRQKQLLHRVMRAMMIS